MLIFKRIYCLLFTSISAIRGNAKVWWQFMYSCIVETSIRRRKREWSWTNILEHRNRCRRYANAYEKKLLCRKVDKVTMDICEQLEAELDIFNLRMIRLRVDGIVEESGVLSLPEPSSSGWFGGWFGGGKSATTAKDNNNDISKFLKNTIRYILLFLT